MSDNIVKGLQVLDPPGGALEFLLGETRIIEYPVINNSDFKMKDLSFEAFTVLKENEGDDYILKSTEHRYVKIIEAQKVVYPNKPEVIKVEVTIPKDYNEQIKKEDGSMAIAPFRIKIRLKGIEHIKEL